MPGLCGRDSACPHSPKGGLHFARLREQFECTYLFIPGGPIGLPGIVSSGGFRIEKLDGYGNCIEILLYLCRCRCETGTCRRPDPGGYWEVGEQRALCAGGGTLNPEGSRSG